MTAAELGPVSVIVSVRDGERYIAEAIDSILGQTAPPDEVVVVDDGSTDSTLSILAPFEPSIRVVSTPPHGQPAALNHGIEVSTGTLLAFLDADDVWTAPSLEARLHRMRAPDAPEAVFGRMAQFVSPDADDTRRYRFDPEPVAAPVFHTMLVRRAAFERVGLLAVEYEKSANIDWMSRALAAGLRTAAIPDLVCRRRIHGGNLSLKPAADPHRDLLHILRVHRQRMRDVP